MIKFVLGAVALTAGAAWTLRVTAPLLVGVPASWATAHLLAVAIPGLALMLAGLVALVSAK